MLISFWLCLFIVKLYSRNDIFRHESKLDHRNKITKKTNKKFTFCQNHYLDSRPMHINVNDA